MERSVSLGNCLLQTSLQLCLAELIGCECLSGTCLHLNIQLGESTAELRLEMRKSVRGSVDLHIVKQARQQQANEELVLHTRTTGAGLGRA